MDKLTGPTNRVGGDFNYEAVEAFRAAYAQHLASPNDDNVANSFGLPTNTIANTSPWYEHVGIWKYPSGRGPEDDLKTPFNPGDYLPNETLDEGEGDEVEDLLNEIADLLGDDD